MLASPASPVATSTSLQLCPRDSKQAELQLEIERLPVVLGRNHMSTIQVADPWVSRRHCEIARVGDDIYVRDLDSRHGTFVNDLPVIEKCLDDGDSLCIGLTVYTVSFQ